MFVCALGETEIIHCLFPTLVPELKTIFPNVHVMGHVATAHQFNVSRNEMSPTSSVRSGLSFLCWLEAEYSDV